MACIFGMLCIHIFVNNFNIVTSYGRYCLLFTTLVYIYHSRCLTTRQRVQEARQAAEMACLSQQEDGRADIDEASKLFALQIDKARIPLNGSKATSISFSFLPSHRTSFTIVVD